MKTGKRSKKGENKLAQFKFIISDNTINYVGSWHFENPTVFFTDEKTELHDSLTKRFKQLDFSSAKILLPN